MKTFWFSLFDYYNFPTFEIAFLVDWQFPIDLLDRYKMFHSIFLNCASAMFFVTCPVMFFVSSSRFLL